MGKVDPDDDSLRRFVAWHFRYDADRREWRNVVLAAFDDEGEFWSFLDARHAELQAAQAAGELDAREQVSGVIHEPGHRTRSQNRRLLRRALDHGVWPSGWDPRDPPDGVSVVSAGDPDRPS
jgi:hypothetical protein